MKCKALEIRDRATFIPALAIQVSGDDGYLFRRAGFARPMVYLVTLATQQCRYDPFAWNTGGITMSVAHQWIAQHFDELADHQVIDVEFILGLTAAPKVSELEEFGQ